MSDSPITEDLIRAAYAVVGRPERLVGLLEDASELGTLDDADAGRLEAHFDQVTRLLDEVDNTIGEDFGGWSGEDPARQSDEGGEVAILRRGPKLCVMGEAPSWLGDWTDGEPLPEWASEASCQALKDINAGLRGQPVRTAMMVRLRTSRMNEAGSLFLAQFFEDDSGPGFRLRPIRLRWDERVGELFASVMKLTPTEATLARYVVDGLTLTQFAESRGRSVGTARNQLKVLQRKLGIASQIDLVSLYGGFHASFLDAEERRRPAPAMPAAQVFTTAGGAALPYETHGPADGIPLLYLHATADGAYLTPRQLAAVRANGFRVIAPWLPFYAGTQYAGSGHDAVEDFCARTEDLLDSLGVERCIIVSVRVSAPYGFRLMQRGGARFCGLVAAGAVTPIRTASDLSHLAVGYRAPMRLARRAPAFVRLYFAAAARMMRRDRGAGFFRSLYGSSEADMAVLEDPEVVEVMRRTMQRTFQDGYEATLQQTLLSAGDWSAFCEGLGGKATLVCGAQDGLAPPEAQRRLCKDYGFDLVGPLDNCGSLLIHQVPRLVFDTARARWDAAQ
ncbi:LuxR C-terminal-related transcriptional regulator [Paraurantiacibacter namhicola]|uniref:Alpha/beta hydrolase family protein n=1 Tax=Paraurantiacibacter namhicola TaxID=645517 RepID=A0A1C7DBA0_9SPHN|nr:LuxR C-terminal-related transcriptional regulator [Paraurantiacibacter namhicola]ANU08724.1 Alpha/beta hydrolase family protein [Paraurantiacibacter namhicola]